jgi:hypothetical protein
VAMVATAVGVFINSFVLLEGEDPLQNLSFPVSQIFPDFPLSSSISVLFK